MGVRIGFIFALAAASGALVFACAEGDDASTSGDVTTTGDAGNGGADDDATTSGGGGGGGGGGTGKDGGSSGNGDGGSPMIDSGPACVEDAGCMTGDPGACSTGNIHCGDGGAVCVPTVTTQACFSSDAGMPNVGICKSGTQSCVGTLGACTGETPPLAIENCFNNSDDNCDGKINEGCPKTIAVGATRTLGGNGGGGGSAKTVMCPAGAFVTRVDSWFDDKDAKASGVSITCATPSLIQGATSYTVTLAANAPAPYAVEHGTQSAAIERTDDCGLAGLTSIAYMTGLSDTFVEAQGHHCATSQVTLDATNKITFNFVNSGATDYNAYAGGGGTFFDSDCNSGQATSNNVVVGYAIRDGAYLDNITPICAPLTVTYGAGTPDP